MLTGDTAHAPVNPPAVSAYKNVAVFRALLVPASGRVEHEADWPEWSTQPTYKARTRMHMLGLPPSKHQPFEMHAKRVTIQHSSPERMVCRPSTATPSAQEVAMSRKKALALGSAQHTRPLQRSRMLATSSSTFWTCSTTAACQNAMQDALHLALYAVNSEQAIRQSKLPLPHAMQHQISADKLFARRLTNVLQLGRSRMPEVGCRLMACMPSRKGMIVHLERYLLHAIHSPLEPRHERSLKLIVLQGQSELSACFAFGTPDTLWQHQLYTAGQPNQGAAQQHQVA